MPLQKTERARAELKPGVRTLGQRERTLLLLADGTKSAQDFHLMFEGDGQEIVLRLIKNGYLERKPQPEPLSAALPANIATPQAIPAPAPPKVSADRFEGKRSMATTRMFLFDICERMFARRNPAMAELFREALRNAKDRETMLTVSRQILEQIEIIAGSERADSISERIAMLLPDNEAADTAA